MKLNNDVLSKFPNIGYAIHWMNAILHIGFSPFQSLRLNINLVRVVTAIRCYSAFTCRSSYLSNNITSLYFFLNIVLPRQSEIKLLLRIHTNRCCVPQRQLYKWYSWKRQVIKVSSFLPQGLRTWLFWFCPKFARSLPLRSLDIFEQMKSAADYHWLTSN